MSSSSPYDAYNPREDSDLRVITYPAFEMWCQKCNCESLNLSNGEMHHEFVWVGKTVRCTRCGSIPVNPSKGNSPWENVGFAGDPENINEVIYTDWLKAIAKSKLKSK